MNDKDALKPVKSSMISAYNYNSEAKTLQVIFKDDTDLTYKEVPPDVMSKVFDSSGSLGSKFHKFIRKQYKSQPSE